MAELSALPDILTDVQTLTLENGIPFHSNVIGLPCFRVHIARALQEGAKPTTLVSVS